MKTLMYLAVLVLALAGCRVRDIRTVVIDVPQLRGEACAQRIHQTLASMGGIDAQALRFEPGQVTVTYDSMKLALKNIEHAIAAQGFQANEIPPNPEARRALPEQCQ